MMTRWFIRVPRISAILLLYCALAMPLMAAEVQPGATLRYTLKTPGKVSLAIYSAEGTLVRELLHAAPRTAGPQTEIWDGLDSFGKPLPEGAYRWKLLGTPGLKAEYLLTLGNNIPDGNGYTEIAPGSHGGPNAIAIDDSGVYIGAGCTENIENYLVKLTPDGSKRLWSQGNPVAWQGATSMALDGGRLYVLTTGGTVWVHDAATGKLAATYKIAWDGDKEFPYDLDAAGGLLAISYSNHDAIRWYNAADGKLVDEVAGMKAPQGIALAPDGTAFITSGTSIIAINRTAKTAGPVATGLTAPGRLDLNPDNGDLLVFDGGDVQQVKRFGFANGKWTLTTSYGRKGGRHDGLYTREMQESFTGLTDVTVDAAGGFCIAEPSSAPRRTAHLDKGGKLLHEWYGGQVWAPFLMVEPDNPSVVWMASHWDSMMRLVIDYKTKTWKVHSTYRYGYLANGLVGGHGNASLWDVRKVNGATYLMRRQSVCVLKVDEKNWRLLPATIGGTHIRHYWNAQPQLIKDWAGPKDDSYLWVDGNGDGQPQREEMTFSPNGGPWGALPSLDEAMNYYFVVNGTPVTVFRNAVTGWNAAGAPLYADFPTGRAFRELPARANSIEGRWASYFYLDPASKAFYAAINNKMPGFGQSSDSFLTKWDEQGKAQWEVGKTIGSAATYVPPGQIGTFRRIAGKTHGCLVLTDFMEGPDPATTYVWDDDGLWVGGIMDAIDTTVTPRWRYGLGAETLSSLLYTDPKTGEVLFFSHGVNDGRVYRITGWDGWERQAGTVILAQPALPEAGSGLRADYFDGANFDNWRAAQLVPTIDRYWGAKTPVAEVKSAKAYSVRWTGTVKPEFTEKYTFTALADGGARLVVNGRTVIDAWNDPGTSTPQQGEVALAAGKTVDIQLEYTQSKGDGDVKLLWESPSVPREVLPTARLFPTNPLALQAAGHGNGLRVEYYNGVIDPKNLASDDIVPNIDITWGVGARPPTVTNGQFMVRWKGRLQPRQTGIYTIVLDWPKIGVFTIDGKRVGPFWPETNTSVYLEAGKFYDLQLDYSNAGTHPSTAHGARLLWMTPANTWPRTPEVIPPCQLYQPVGEG